MGYVQYTNDPCIYTLAGETIIGVYVDDFVIAGESSERIEQVKTSLSEKFDIKDLGELHYFLGVQVIQDHKRGTVWMSQPTFAESVLQKYHMSEAKSVKTPVSVNSKLLKASGECELVIKSAVGSLLYMDQITSRHCIRDQQCCSFLLQTDQTALDGGETNFQIPQRDYSPWPALFQRR